MNDALFNGTDNPQNWIRGTLIKNPTGTVCLLEWHVNGNYYGVPGSSVNREYDIFYFYHSGGSNFLWFDGHVDWYRSGQMIETVEQASFSFNQ